MLIRVNGKEIDAAEGSKLFDVIKGHHHKDGTYIALIRPSGTTQQQTSEFELVTTRGTMVVQLNDSTFASTWRTLVPQLTSVNVRWKTSKVFALGSFQSSLEVDRGSYDFLKYDCFFALGGFDNRTTYMMIARTDHKGQYGVKDGRIGRMTRGRHILDLIQEGDRILEVRPVLLELSEKNAFVTDDLDTVVEEGMSVETYVGVDLDRRSPVSCEQFLVVTESGTVALTDKTATYSACSDRTDVSLVPELSVVREEGDVTVRHDGSGSGRIYFYRKRRQLSPSHNLIGKVSNGKELMQLAPQGSRLTLISDPARIITIGMTQKEAGEFLASNGLVQSRTGLATDDAVVSEQEPELTMEIGKGQQIETFGVAAERISDWEFEETGSPKTVHYLRKMTGLDHKKIGTMKVFFTYPDMPMVTFVGDAKEASVLLPERSFDPESPAGQIAVTNMSRPNRGSIGIRLQSSAEFGPTGEERYGTNVAGNVLKGLEAMLKDLKDGDIVYLRESKSAPTIPKGPVKEKAPKAKAKKAPAKKKGTTEKAPVSRAKAAKKKEGGRPRTKASKPE